MTTRNSLDERIRAAVSELLAAAPPAPPFPDADAHPPRNRATMAVNRRHGIELVLVAAVVLAVFFVPLPHVSLFSRLHQGSSVGPSSTSPVARNPTTSTVIPSAPVTVRLVLDRTRVVAGTPIHGEALLTNTTSQSITVKTCAADGWLLVGLTNGQVEFNPATRVPACSSTLRLSPGVSRFPITVSTSYQACTQSKTQAIATLPACTPTGSPPLPSGAYVTRIIVVGLPASTQLPPAISVRLLPPGGGTAAACVASQLAVGDVGGSGAAGTGVTTIRITNASHEACTLAGYPILEFANQSGAQIPTTVGHSGSGPAFGSPSTVTLPPGVASSAGFVVTTRDFPTNGATSCPIAMSVSVALPKVTGSFTVHLADHGVGVNLCDSAVGISSIVKGSELDEYAPPRTLVPRG